MIADNSSKLEDNLYIAVSIEEDINKLSNRQILNPRSNTYVINTKDQTRQKREYNAATTDLVGAGTGRIQITAWGSIELIAKTLTSVRLLKLTHVAYV